MTRDQTPPGDDVVFALHDGDYHIGLGALANSLYRHGFRGIIMSGYRGAPPPWAHPLEWGPGSAQYRVGEGCAIRFIAVDFEGHLTNYKPKFILSLLEKHCQKAKRLFYFDVDIVIKCRWSFFQDWVECGIAVCRDVNEPHMSSNHPLRRYWRDFAAQLDYQCRPVDGYVNGGFVGLRIDYVPFLRTWQALIEHQESAGTSLSTFNLEDRANPFTLPEQDALNVALMATSMPISMVENSGMDFSNGGYVMSHAISRAKPWRRGYISDALRGYPPDKAHKLFWDHVTRPIEMYDAGRRRRAAASLRIASAIGRFYRRT
jgi:hypothetical protein